QHRRLLPRRTDHHAVAYGDDRLAPQVASFIILATDRARQGADVLPLMAKAAGALADIEGAGLAETVAPAINAGQDWRAGPRQRLAANGTRSPQQRKGNLGIDRVLGATGPARPGPSDVAAWPIPEISGRSDRPLCGDRGDISPLPRWLTADHTQCLQQALGNR